MRSFSVVAFKRYFLLPSEIGLVTTAVLPEKCSCYSVVTYGNQIQSLETKRAGKHRANPLRGRHGVAAMMQPSPEPEVNAMR